MGADTLIDVLHGIHEHPRKLQSNFIRDNSYSVARLASLGLITTKVKAAFGHSWRVTYRGLKVLDAGEQE